MKKFLLFCITAVVLYYLVQFSLARARQWSDAKAEQQRQAQAIEAVKTNYLQRLFRPSTAKWPDDLTVSKYQEFYVVRGYVDAQTKRGAGLRTYFTALVKDGECVGADEHETYDEFKAYKLPGE